ncbi:TPA_asm: hypothetical protein GNB58_004926 [Salmonella enterica subsp. houtenae serovar 45:g,z51:-]|uniref:Uncharacterized protein n=1 Tax=Salmonella enterica subsp. houtenae serovar 45:g,z51:- TaxID=1967611 RepID=A0A736VFB6_SALHO|nr:hypothetical protein [Salmonella enterica subsp. houtenae str. CFSAN000557]HAE7767794.1 hypothetical protein [Salmonella enterica subsp. houtenae serovar 45:g,z51:-]
MCNCINEVGAQIETRLKEKVPEGAEVSESTFDTGWDNQVLSLSEGKLFVMLKYKLAYRAKKKNGEMAKNLNRLETNVKMSFCPFCGESQG